MFGLFFSLVNSLLTGYWEEFDSSDAFNVFSSSIRQFIAMLASLFRNIGLKLPDTFDLNDADQMFIYMDQNLAGYSTMVTNHMFHIVAGVISLVVCIGIIMVTIKAIKSIFRVFLGGRLS